MSNTDAAYLHNCTLKMAKWSNRAEDARNRKEAQKALKKYAKWSLRLAEYEDALRLYGRDVEVL